MKKFALSGLLIFSFLAYVVIQRMGVDEDRVEAPRMLTPVASPVAAGSPSPRASATTTAKGQYKDGTYDGSVADAFYGNVQVEVVVTGGKISDVKFLQSPNDRPTSVEINTQAMPLLKQETIAAQTAQVDMVSGATQTSRAFLESLQSALQQAS